MKLKHLITFLFCCVLYIHSAALSQPDSVKVSSILEKINRLEGSPLERAEYVSQIDHLYLERYSPQLFKYIKREYDNLNNIYSASLNLKFDISHLMEDLNYVTGQYDQAATIAYDLLKIANQTKDSLHYYYAYSSIATVEEEMGNLESGFEFLLLAKEYAMIDQNSLAQTNIDLGYSYLSQDKDELSKKHISTAIQIAAKEKDYFLLVYGYCALLDYYYKVDNLDSAIICFEKTASIVKENLFLESSRGFVNATIGAAETYRRLGEYDKAEGYFEAAYNLAKESNDRPNLSYIYRRWSELEELRGDYPRSLELFKQCADLQDSLYNEASILQLNTLKIAYEVDKKDLEIKVSKQKGELANKQIWFIAISSIIFIAGLIVFVFLLKSRLKETSLREKLIKEKEKLNENEIINLEREVQIKNKELADLFLHQFEKAQLLNDVLENVDQSNEKLKSALQEQQNQGEDWINFKAHFNKVHEGFFETLYRLSPDLTSKDIRFCAYMRMNLSSKEIAIMQGISYRTVQGIRGRVRKKLNLDSSQDLVFYLMSL